MLYSRFLAITLSSAILINTAFAAGLPQTSLFKNNSRDYISIVGSSTVYPFTATIAEKFGRQKKFRTPTVESTGTGGGFKLFCSGIGFEFPDFSNASRNFDLGSI